MYLWHLNIIWSKFELKMYIKKIMVFLKIFLGFSNNNYL